MGGSGLTLSNSNGPAAVGVLDQRLSFDVQSVDALRRTVRNSPQEGMKQASKQFEVLFMQMVLKSMRDATPSDGVFGSQQEKLYTSMLDQQLAQSLSGRGLGLADAMFAQLSRSIRSETTSPAPGVAPPAPVVTGKLPELTVPMAPLKAPAQQAALAPTPVAPLTPAPDLSVYEKDTAQAMLSRSVFSQTYIEQFVSRLLPAAQRASQESGIPAQLIMAQAALESGWGQREIRADDGHLSYNLFAVKADKNWKGPVIQANTTEYVNGIAKKTRAVFRAYNSYEEGFSDYARLLGGSPRYAKVRLASNPADAALGLQQAGYATDPQYGRKLIRIMKQMT